MRFDTDGKDIYTMYCTYKCGRKAVRLVPLGMVGETPVGEWVCDPCGDMIMIGKEYVL